MHEVVSGAGFGGMAGLNAVGMNGVEDIDISEFVGGMVSPTQLMMWADGFHLKGHFDINANMGRLLQAVRVNE